MSIIIRQFIKTDYEIVLKLHVEGLNQFNASVNDPSLDKDIKNIEEHYLLNGSEFLVGLCDDRIIGMGAFRRKSNDIAEVKRIRIDKDHQKKGYCEVILKSLERSAKDKGYKKLVLDTTVIQVPAQKLFNRNGYIETNRKLIKELELIFYEKELKD